MKDKGEREKRGPEASGLTPVERGRERKERKTASPSVCCVAPRKAPRGWWGAPGQRPPIGGVLHGCPSGPALVHPPPAPPPAVCLVIGWEPWEGRPWCVYCRRSQSLGSCQPHSPWQVLLKGGLSSTLRSGAERSHLAQVRGPDRDEDTLCPPGRGRRFGPGSHILAKGSSWGVD